MYFECIKSFLPGFLGKNCEVDIDACALPNNTCPSRTQCLDLSDGLAYTCRVPCPQNLQVGKKILMDYLSSSAVLYPHGNNSSWVFMYMFKELPIFCLFLLEQYLCILHNSAATLTQQQGTRTSKLVRTFYVIFSPFLFRGASTLCCHATTQNSHRTHQNNHTDI